MRIVFLLAGACVIAAACAPPEPPNPPPPPVPPPVPESTVLVPVPAEDPRVVRCGIDDRPRSVVGALELPSPRRLTGDERAFFGDRPARMEPMPMSPPPMQPPRKRPPPIEDPPPPRPPLTVSTEPPRPLDGHPISSALAAALATSRLSLEACDDLVDLRDEGVHGLEVALSSSGAPTDVRVSDPVPSKLVRCAMERACQLRGPAGETARIGIPLIVRRERPLPPPPAVVAVPSVPVRVTWVTGAGGELAAAAERAASQCLPATPGARIRVELAVTRSRVAGNGRTARPEITTPTTRTLEGSDPQLLACTVSHLFDRGSAASRDGRAQVVQIVWNP